MNPFHGDALMNENARSYDVGFRKPPVHTRFKKGQSGNPNGRPKGAQQPRSLNASIAAELDEPTTIIENGKRSVVTNREAILQRLVQRAAIDGDARALKILLKYLDAAEPKNLPLICKFLEPIQEVIDSNESVVPES